MKSKSFSRTCHLLVIQVLWAVLLFVIGHYISSIISLWFLFRTRMVESTNIRRNNECYDPASDERRLNAGTRMQDSYLTQLTLLLLCETIPRARRYRTCRCGKKRSFNRIIIVITTILYILFIFHTFVMVIKPVILVINIRNTYKRAELDRGSSRYQYININT